MKPTIKFLEVQMEEMAGMIAEEAVKGILCIIG
jgi:hypothetical protein